MYIVQNWQRIVNIMTNIFDVPAGLIMRVHPPTIEVFLHSENRDIPYKIGETANLEGLYCNTVMQTQKTLSIPNALQDPVWDHNPDINLGMISYLGMPINWPNGNTFGTICVLDTKERTYKKKYMDLLDEFKNMVENHLQMIVMIQQVSDLNEKIDNFNKTIPKCVYCDNVKIADDSWITIDDYLRSKRSTSVSHGICPDCLIKNYDKIMEE